MNGFANDFRKAAQDNVVSLMSKVELPIIMSVTPSDLAAAEPPTKKKCPGLSFLLGEQETAAAPEIPTADDEFQRYFGERAVINESYDALKWWEANCQRYPRLAVLARRYLCNLPTSVALERLFSLSGRVISKTHSRLLPETAASAIFLNKNQYVFDDE